MTDPKKPEDKQGDNASKDQNKGHGGGCGCGHSH